MRWISKSDALVLVKAEQAEIEERFDGCAMCACVAGGARGRAVLASNAAAVAMLDRFAARPGHVVVVLRRHVEAIAELSWEEHAGVQRLAWEAARALSEVMSPVRVYVAALGSSKAIGISFPHHHVHVIPLADGGEMDRPAEVLTWRHGIHVFEAGEEEAFAERLRAAWPAPVPAPSAEVG
ncbi:MAG: HIT domain-containing protein [Polyangiaceae bacterium]